MDWTEKEKSILKNLTTPVLVQEFLDTIPYSADPIYRCPRSVLHDRKAHCFDGAVMAAAALERIGFPPLIMELKAVHDDDHLLALFRRGGLWGAVAKSNFVGLRYREPIHRSLRELAISYFDDFYNTAAEKTLRGYSVWIDLRRFCEPNWRFSDTAMDLIADKLDRIRHYPLISKNMVRALATVDPRSLKAGLLGSDEKGLYKPDK